TDSGRLREAIALQRGGSALAEANGLHSIQLRGLNNLAARLFGEDPRESWSTLMASLDVAARAGDGESLLGAIEWFVGFSVPLGKWDEGLARIDEHERPDLPASVRVAFASARLNSLAFRGEASAAEAVYE